MCMVALHAGSKKLMMGWAIDAQTPLTVSSLAYQGLLSATTQKPWPASYTYGLVTEKLDGLQSLRRLPLPQNIYVYECTVPAGRKVYVAFCDDHIGQNHDQPAASIDAAIPFPDGLVRLTHIITDLGVVQPKTEMLTALGGSLRLRLTEFPVFLEPTEP